MIDLCETRADANVTESGDKRVAVHININICAIGIVRAHTIYFRISDMQLR